MPWYSHRHAVLSRLAPVFLPGRVPSMFNELDDSGVGPPTGNPRSPEAYRHNVEVTLKAYAPCFEGFALGGPSADALRELLELCRHEHIATALVLMPEGTAFRELYSPEAFSQIDAFLCGLSREFHAPLINAREWVPDEEFADSHHLLLSGATRFTERLGRDHLAPMLIPGTRTASR